jgi:NAD+ synthetase
MKIHLVQAKPRVGNVQFNLLKIKQEVKEGVLKKADIICFPELFLCGYPIEDRLLFADFKNDIQNAIKDILEFSSQYSCLIALPTPVFNEKSCFNSILLIKKGVIENQINKIHLPNYGVFDEKRYFQSGESPKIYLHKDKKIIFAICEEIWQEDYIFKVKLLKPDLLIIINASPFEKDKFKKRLELCRVFECEALYLNQVLGYDEIAFDGRSFGINAKGKICFLMRSFEEQTLTFNLGDSLQILQEEESDVLYKALVFNLREYCSQSQISSVVFGLSGGIDSALCAKIAIDALGKENIYPVLLPSQISSEEGRKDAMDFLSLNKIKASEISIAKIFDSVKNTLGENLERLTIQNLQSRIRGLLLMTISNETGRMVITTGNKSELAIGYCTIYGDMNGGFNPIKDLFKTEVFEICRLLNAKNPIFPTNMVKKPPTAELEIGQTDEASFGIPYLVLDFILKKMIEEKSSFKEIERAILENGLLTQACKFREDNNLAKLNEEELVEYVYSLLKKAQFKRSQSVCGTKVSPCGFGRDWRFGVKM